MNELDKAIIEQEREIEQLKDKLLVAEEFHDHAEQKRLKSRIWLLEKQLRLIV